MKQAIFGRLLTLMLGLCLLQPSHAELLIGQSSPLTGVAAETGKGLALGAKVYFDSLNAQGGINGRKIRHLLRDDQYQVSSTIANANELIDKDNALALVNFYGTGNIGELLQQKTLERAGIPLVGVYTGALATREPFTPLIYHTRAGYHDEVDKITRMLAEMGLTDFAVLYQADPFGEAGLVAARKSAEKYRMKLVGAASYPKLTTDVRAAAETLARLNPSAVIMISITKPTAAFVQTFRALGGTSQLFNISVANYDELVRLDGKDAVHGIGISQVFPSPHATRLKLIRQYQELLKKYAPQAQPSYASLEGFINAKVLAEAIRRAGADPSRAQVARALDGMNNFDLGDVSISFSKTNHQGSRFVELTMIGQSGELAR